MSARVAAASLVDSAILPPVQRGTSAACGGAGFTHAVSSRTRSELQHAPGEDEAVAGREAGDEAFLDVAERRAVPEPHGDARLGDDRADADPVPARDARVGNRGDAVVADDDAPVFRIRVEAGAAVHDEVERELPFVVGQRGIGARAADFVAQRIRHEAAAERAGDEVLDQHVLRRGERRARLDRARGRGLARRRGLDQLQRLRRERR